MTYSEAVDFAETVFGFQGDRCMTAGGPDHCAWHRGDRRMVIYNDGPTVIYADGLPARNHVMCEWVSRAMIEACAKEFHDAA